MLVFHTVRLRKLTLSDVEAVHQMLSDRTVVNYLLLPSDNRSFWNQGYRALTITDTASCGVRITTRIEFAGDARL